MTTLTPVGIAQAARGAGFSGDSLTTAVAVALAESSGQVEVINSIGCVGLWQIYQKVHAPAHPTWTTAWLQNAANNAIAAYSVSSGGTNWGPWTTYTSGAYKAHLAAATTGVAASGGTTGGGAGGAAAGTPAAPPADAAVGHLDRGPALVAATPLKAYGVSDLDVSDLGRQLTLVWPGKKTPPINLIDAIAPDVTVTLTIDGAATLDIPLADYQRTLLRNDSLGQKCWVVLHDPAGDIHFELVGLGKVGDILTLRFEDALVAALRGEKGKLSIPAGKQTIPQIVQRLVNEPRAKIPAEVDTTTDAGVVTTPTQRSIGKGNKTNSWDVLADIVGAVKWRRFSTGRELVVGSDPWLLSRKPAFNLRENTGGVVGSIDFDWDIGQPRNDITVVVDARVLTFAPGDPVTLGDDMGPMADTYLVSQITRPLSSVETTLTLTRKVKPLHEPKKVKPVGNPGDPSFLPGQTADGTTAPPSGTTSPSSGSNSARTTMVNFALAQRGKPYVWGGHGPDVWDCSGLIMGATTAAGKPLYAPAASQAATCANSGDSISVAEGIATYGALLFRIGTGTYDHVVISLGNGTTMEARGSAYGCNVFGDAAGGGWTGAALWV